MLAMCSGMTNVLTNEGLFNIDLNPMYRPMAADALADATLKQIESDIEAANAEKKPDYPHLVYCPRLSNSADTLPVGLRPTGDLGKLYDKASANTPLQHHIDVTEMFSLVVNSGTADDYNEAATRYRQMFGETAKSNNAGFFVFHGGFQSHSGWQHRYQGPAFNFLDAFETGRIVPAMKDDWVRDWLIFWLRFNRVVMTEAEAEEALTHVSVSHSASICWSLLLQGRQETVVPNMVPNALEAEPLPADTPQATVWQEKCVYKCGPKAKTDGTCTSDVNCKAKCLADSKCKGYYLTQGCAGKSTCGAIVRTAPRDNELANAQDSGFGTYNLFYAKELYESNGGAGIAFHELGTFPVGKRVVQTHVYKKKECDSTTQEVEGTPHETLTQCENARADRCVKKTSETDWHGVAHNETVASCAAVHERISRNVPSACRATCLDTDTCLSWTWDAGTCTHYTGVGELTTSSVVPDLGMLQELGMDVSYACNKTDQVYDMCVQKCVHIRNKLHHGWCNHKWVNCKAGKFAEAQTDIPVQDKGKSVCTGGFHPEKNTLLGSNIVQYRTGRASPLTYRAYAGFKFPLNYGDESDRSPVSFGGREGAYTATRCGDIGAYIMDSRNVTFNAWQEFSRGELHTNVEGRMSKLVEDSEVVLRDWPTHTFVSMGQGSKSSMDGNAYASPLAGTSAKPADGIGPITFPKCQISGSTHGRLYSFTRGQKCVEDLNANMKAYYEKSVTFMGEPTSGLSGTPFYGTTVTSGPALNLWADQGRTSGLYTRETADKAKHLLCFRPEPRMTTLWSSQHGDDDPGYGPYAFEARRRRRGVKGTSANQHLVSQTAVLIDSHSSEQCKIHQTPNHLVTNVAFERAYGDNEACYMDTDDMKEYYDPESTTLSNTLRQFPRGVGCKATAKKTVLLSGFQPFYTRVMIDREIDIGHSYYYTRHDGSGTSYKSFVDGTPASGSGNAAQCKRGSPMRNDAINFMARACVEGPRAFFSRAENLKEGVTVNVKNAYPPCCKMFQIDNNCDMYFYSVSSSPAGAQGLPVNVAGFADGATGEKHANTEGWPYAEGLNAAKEYKGFAHKDGSLKVCPGMTANTQWTDAEYAFAAAHPSNNKGTYNPTKVADGVDVYMVHNPAMKDSKLINYHNYYPIHYDTGSDLGSLPKDRPSWAPLVAGVHKQIKCHGVVYYGDQATKWLRTASFPNQSPQPSDTVRWCNDGMGNPGGDTKNCYCLEMKDMYFAGSYAYGLPVRDKETKKKFREIAHYGATTDQFAADTLTYQQQCWRACQTCASTCDATVGPTYINAGTYANKEDALAGCKTLHSDAWLCSEEEARSAVQPLSALEGLAGWLTCYGPACDNAKTNEPVVKSYHHRAELNGAWNPKWIPFWHGSTTKKSGAFCCRPQQTCHTCSAADKKYCIFTGARFYGEVAAMGEPTCYLSETCDMELSANATVASFLQTTVGAEGLAEEATLQDLVDDGAMRKESLDHMHPRDGTYVQNAQRAFADGGTKEQSTTYFPPPVTAYNEPSRELYRNPNPTTDGTVWKRYVATVHKPGKTRYPSQHLPSSADASYDVNVANAGFMCPVGVIIGGSTDTPLTAVKNNLAIRDDWHPLAQTTLMCPYNKPVRCSKLVVVEVAGGTCEYSSETGKQQHHWSGATAQTIEPGNENMENWKSKLGQNAPCHRYDFACHSIADDEDTEVCGRDSKVENALGGARCGTNPAGSVPADTGGFCGVDATDGTNVDIDKAHCAKWPTGDRKVCPDGFVYFHGKDAPRATCVPARAAHKDHGVLREYLAPTLVMETGGKDGQYYTMSSCKEDTQVATADGRCIDKDCAARKSKELCESQDLIPDAKSCGWSASAQCTVRRGVRAKNDATVTAGVPFTPEIGFNGQWYPICGHWFWNNNNGATTVCKALGFTTGVVNQLRGVGALTLTTQAKWVGLCAADTRLELCEADKWGMLDPDNVCGKGGTGGMTITCSGPNSNTPKHWWPGFVQKKGAFSGVGPAYVKAFEKCDDTSSTKCKGFDKCGKYTSPVAGCTAPANIKAKCCARAGVSIDVAKAGVCEASPSTKCAGGKFMYNTEDSQEDAPSITPPAPTGLKCPTTHPWVAHRHTGSGSTTGVGKYCCRAKPTPAGTPLGSILECLENAYVACPSSTASTACTHGFVGGAQMCSCNQDKCEAGTDVESATVALKLETGLDTGFTADLEELFLVLVDSGTGASVRAEGCTGPQSRLEGGEFGACACQPAEKTEAVSVSSGPVYEKPNTGQCLEHVDCFGISGEGNDVGDVTLWRYDGPDLHYNPDGYTSYQSYPSRSRPYRCNYYETCAPDKPFPGAIAFTKIGTRDISHVLVDCQSFEAVHRAQHWCVGLGDSCAYLAKVSPDTYPGIYCALPDLPPDSGPTYTVYEKHTAHDLYDYTHGTSAVNLKVNATLTMFDANAAAVCSADPECAAYKVENGDDLLLYKAGGSSLASGVYLKGAKRPAAAPCPPLQPCVHGTNVRQGDKCVCRCDDFFAGPLCDRCSSANRDETCRACKDNFMPGQNDVCICQPGFDISTGCTTCKSGFEGVFCQTNTCAVTMQETVGPLSYTLKNVAIAYDAAGQLYDGVIGAGDGRVPYSMQNTFVKVHGKMWFLYASPTVARVEVTISTKCQKWNDAVWQSCSAGAYYKNVNQLRECKGVSVDKSVWVADRAPLFALCNPGEDLPERDFIAGDGLPTNTVHTISGGEWLYSIPEKPGPKTVAEIEGDEDTWGYVCTLGTGSKPPTDAADAPACATTCPTTTCGSWHWNNGTCTTYALNSTQEFTASEHNIDTRNCRSGGVRLAGKYRNLPAMPSLAVPNATRMLQKVPDNMLWTVVCAYGNGTAKFILSEYRRHPWTGGPCAQQVQLTWLYSLPRGQAMDVTTPHYHGLTRSISSLLTGAAGNATACADECKNADPRCELWIFTGIQCSLGLGEAIFTTPVTAYAAWGGALKPTPMVPPVASMSSNAVNEPASKCVDGNNANMCHSLASEEGNTAQWLQLDLGSRHRIYAVKIWNRGDCTVCQGRLGLHELQLSDDATAWTTCGTYTAPSTAGPFEEPCTGTARYVRIHQLTNKVLNLAEVQVLHRAYLLPDKSAALPDVATSISTVSNYRECCYACEGSASWQMAGARCACYDGGKMNGGVGKCYVPTKPAAGQECNVAITMVTEGTSKPDRAKGTCFNLLAVTKYPKPEHCSALCLDEEECDVAHYSNDEVCTLLQCTRPDLAKGDVDTGATLYIKSGACVEQANGMCHYRPRRAGHASGACSANGASVAYQADVRLYYNDDNEGNSVPVLGGQGCSDATGVDRAAAIVAEMGKLEPALPSPPGVLLQTADTNLLMHRFDPGVYPSTTGFEYTDSPENGPTQAAAAITRDMRLPTLNVAGRRRRTVPNALGVAPNQAATFQITQSIAVPLANAACHEQARLATVMAGLKSPSMEQGRCSGTNAKDLVACTRVKHYTSALETIQAAYVQQLASCHAEAVGMDYASPLQLMMYVQPRAGLERIEYHGLPTYYAPRNVHDTAGLPRIDAMPMGSDLAPAVAGTPVPTLPVFETPSPTPSRHIDTPNIKCTAQEHCCFVEQLEHKTSPAWHAEEKVLEISVATQHVAGTGPECMALCARFLLCRVAEWTDGVCHMWSLPIKLAHLQHNETFWVTPPETDCVPSASIMTQGVRSSRHATVYVKQDCCLRHMLH